jgi:hypothetical protein
MAEYFPWVLKLQLNNNLPNLEEFEFFQDYKTAKPGCFDKFLLQNTDSFS